MDGKLGRRIASGRLGGCERLHRIMISRNPRTPTMTFKEGLLHARHHIVFLLGLIGAFGLVIGLETWNIEQEIRESMIIEDTAGLPVPQPAELTEQEKQWAEISWRYFENNYQPTTGLVNSVDKYPAATMWDTASYLLALIAAQGLELIQPEKFDKHMAAALAALSQLPLFDSQLPNKSYNTVSLEMVNYQNEKSERGIGWSAIDIGRLMVPFNILTWNFPQHTAAVRAVLKRWDFSPMIRDGVMYGAAVDEDGDTIYVQEGRIGYEEYGAKALALAGLDVSRALNYQDFLRFIKVYGVKVPTDDRNPEKYHAHNYVVSENYILDGLEYGWDDTSKEFAYRVYKAQEERFEHRGILTAVSEDNLDVNPYFVYNTVFTDGKTWNTITEAGDDASAFKTLSTKAAFGWDALYRTDYTAKLMEKASTLFDAERGFYSGLYERTQEPNRAITANSNAIILESLYFRRFGPFLRIGK
ncbi:MAG: DUF3131 domain-containing protein [Pseudomonadota bacterium]|nr:DUF3131 domain-containing protein [Pseudomonadota bacterium]